MYELTDIMNNRQLCKYAFIIKIKIPSVSILFVNCFMLKRNTIDEI